MAAFCTFVVAVLLAPYAVSLEFVQSRIRAAVSSDLRGECQLEEVAFSWFSGVSISGMRIGNPPGFATDKPAIMIKSLTADISLMSLLFGPVSAEAEIVGLEINVEQNADGTTNLQMLAPESPQSESPQPNPKKSEPPSQPDAIAFDVKLTDCAVTMRREGKLLEALTEFACHARSSADLASVMINASGKLQAGSIAIDVQHDLNQDTTNANLICRGLDLASWQPLIDSMMPEQITALAGKVDGEISVQANPGEQTKVTGELIIDSPRLAGPIVQGMDLNAKQWKVTPTLVLGNGASPIDTSQFAIDLEWLRVQGKPSDGTGKVRLGYDINLGRLAEFGGPMPAMLIGSDSQLSGELQVPMDDLPSDASGWATALAATANLSVTALDVAGFALRNVGLNISMEKGALTLSTSESTLLDGGALIASINVDLLDFDNMPATASLQWNGGQLSGGATQGLRYVMPLFAGLDADVAQMAGDVNLEVRFNGPAMKSESQDWLDWLDTWSGSGALGLANTAFAPSQQLQGLLSPLGSLGKGSTSISEKGQLKIDSFNAPFAFQEGVVSTKSSEWVAAGQKIGLSGNVGFDGNIDYTIDLSALLNSRKDGQKVLKVLNGKLPAASLTGTIDRPKLGLPKLDDIATKLLEQQGKDLLKKGLNSLFKKL